MIRYNTVSYTRTTDEGGVYQETEVREELILSLDIENVEGTTVLTHIGANKRLRFIFEGEVFESKTISIALNANRSRAIRFSSLIFDKDVEYWWKEYIRRLHADVSVFWIDCDFSATEG